MPVSADVRFSVTGQHTSVLDLGTATFPFSGSLIAALANGVLANQADRVFTDTRTLAPSATEDLDLAGVLLDPYGVLITFAKLKAIVVKAAVGNTNNVNVTRPATNGVPLFTAVSSGLPIKPGGGFLWLAPDLGGVTVTPATGDLITFTNGGAGTSVTYDVILIGTSA